jgi:hypothetical protein
MNTVYVFNGINSGLPAAIFTSKKKAIEWANRTGVSGTLTEMPLDISAYEHAIQNNLFEPKKEKEREPRFIATFTSRLWHDHVGPDWNRDAG